MTEAQSLRWIRQTRLTDAAIAAVAVVVPLTALFLITQFDDLPDVLPVSFPVYVGRPAKRPLVPEDWRLGQLYCNSADPALFVPDAPWSELDAELWTPGRCGADSCDPGDWRRGADGHSRLAHSIRPI